MSSRYGVADYSCGSRTVAYQPDGCLTCLTIKLGEVQIFDVDFSAEVKCRPVKRNCILTYDEIVNVISFSATPETTFGGGGTIVASVGNIDPRSGIVKFVVDATNVALSPDEKWALSISVSLESGRILKQCFNVRLIECGEVCLTGAPDCTGPILQSIANCGNGVFNIQDEIPVGTVCAQITSTSDTLYTLDGTPPHDPSANPAPLAAGNTVNIVNASELAGFRMSSCYGDCGEICVSRTYRGA